MPTVTMLDGPDGLSGIASAAIGRFCRGGCVMGGGQQAPASRLLAVLVLCGITGACAGPGASATPTRSLIPDWTQALSSVCINSSGPPYPGIDAGPVVEAVERLTDRIGVRVATTGDCDATLTVTLAFTPLSSITSGFWAQAATAIRVRASPAR